MVTVEVGGDRIEATGDHPFWVIEGDGLAARPAPAHVPASEPESATTGRWVDARELRVGDALLSRAGGPVRITGVETAERTVPVFNLRVASLHTFFVGTRQILVHNRDVSPSGRFTEPDLPKRTIVNERGVRIEHYTRTNDHPPAHAHVYGEGPNTKIGANGRPIRGYPPLSPAQKRVVGDNLPNIRRDINKIRRWWRWSRYHSDQ